MNTSFYTRLLRFDVGFRTKIFDAHKAHDAIIVLSQKVIKRNSRSHLATNFQDILKSSELHEL